MEDAENTLPPSKKRAAGRELTRDTPLDDDEEDTPELETGTFKRANDEVLATRRIVKVRRQRTSSVPSSNPFAGIRMVAPTESSSNPVEATAQAKLASESATADDTKGNDGITKDSENAKDGDNKQPEIQTDEVEDKSAANNDAAEESTKREYTAEKESASDTLEVDKEQSVDGNNNKNDHKYVAEKESAGDKPEVDKEQSVDGNNNENDDKYVAEKESASEKPEVDKEQSKDGTNNENEDKDVADKESAREVDKEKTEHDEDKKDDTDNEDKKSKVENEEPSAEGGPLKSFQQLSSSQNAFTGLAGIGFSSSSFSFGSISNYGSTLGSGSSSIFGLGLSNNGSSVFGVSGSSAASKGEGSGFSTIQEVVVETGEENEKVVFNADSVLFEFVDGSWKERGKGELKVNVTITGIEKARLLMRSRGNYRLILNARLYPDMKLTNMDKRGVTFACVNSATEGKNGLSTFALKFKDGSIVEQFKAAIFTHTHRCEASRGLKTPENSP